VQNVENELRFSDGFMVASLVGYATMAVLFFTRPVVPAAVTPVRGGLTVDFAGTF
jgi:hypothetical protein